MDVAWQDAGSIHRCWKSRGCGSSEMDRSMETTTQAPITTIAEVGRHEGQAVTIRGWLYNMRESGKLLFPIFRDGTGMIQGVVPKNEVSPEVFDAIKNLTQESSVIVSGKVRADKRAPGGYELDVSNVESGATRCRKTIRIPSRCKEHGVDFLMEHRHLWMRTPRQAAILRVRAEIIRAARDFFDDQRLHPHRSAHSHARRLRRHDDAVSGGLLRRPGVSHAIRPALH